MSRDSRSVDAYGTTIERACTNRLTEIANDLATYIAILSSQGFTQDEIKAKVRVYGKGPQTP